MIEISKEEFMSLFNKQQKGLRFIKNSSVVMLVLSFFFCYRGFDFVTGIQYILLLLLLLLVDFIFVIMLKQFQKKTVPDEMQTPLIKKVSMRIQNDFCSDDAIRFYQDCLQKTNDPREILKLNMFISDAYSVRGQLAEAVRIMQNVDRSVFQKYPELGISYYASYMEIYADVEDWESVKAVYRDGEPYFRKFYSDNYIRCMRVIDALILMCHATGDHQKALEYRLLRTQTETDFYAQAKTEQKNMSPLYRFVKGQRFYNLSKTYLYCGEAHKAMDNWKKCEPLLDVTPYMKHEVLNLRKRIEELS